MGDEVPGGFAGSCGLYKDYRLYVNFFRPVLKLRSKTRVLIG